MNRTKRTALFTFLFAGIYSADTKAQQSNVDSTFSRFIPLDSANKMIQSYLNSLSSTTTNLHSVVFSADSLRRMLNDETNGRISNVKIMFAHTLDYINRGGANTACGYQSGALTLVIAGYDQNGNYIFYPAGKALNIGRPCPPSCPTAGTASDDLLTTQ